MPALRVVQVWGRVESPTSTRVTTCAATARATPVCTEPPPHHPPPHLSARPPPLHLRRKASWAVDSTPPWLPARDVHVNAVRDAHLRTWWSTSPA